MRVVYKRSIGEQIYILQNEAHKALKEIDYIVLTEEEWRQAEREYGPIARFTTRSGGINRHGQNMILGVKIIVDDPPRCV